MPDPKLPATSRVAYFAPQNFVADAIQLLQDEENLDRTIMPSGQDGESSDDDGRAIKSMASQSQQRDKSATRAKSQPKYVESYDVPEFLWDIEQVSDWSRRIADYTAE